MQSEGIAVQGEGRTKKICCLVMGVLATLLLLFGLLFYSVERVCMDEGFWAKEYQKLGNAATMGMTDEELTAATMRMMEYMLGRAESIDITVMVNGTPLSMFNDRERAHMVDVQELYLGLRKLALTAILIGIALFAIAQGCEKKRGFRLLRYYGVGSAVFLGVLLCIGIGVIADFSSFWTRFHELFFDNDLWLLDPATSRMINMMPLALFYDVVLRVGLLFLGIWAALLALLYAGKRLRAKRQAGAEGMQRG